MILQELELEVEGLERGRERTLKLQRLFRNKDEHSAVLNFLQTKLDGRGELDEGELVEGAIDAASGCGDSGAGDDCAAASDAGEAAPPPRRPAPLPWFRSNWTAAGAAGHIKTLFFALNLRRRRADPRGAALRGLAGRVLACCAPPLR